MADRPHVNFVRVEFGLLNQRDKNSAFQLKIFFRLATLILCVIPKKE